MRGSRANYGKAGEMRKLTLRLDLTAQIKLRRLAREGETLQDTIIRLIAEYA